MKKLWIFLAFCCISCSKTDLPHIVSEDLPLTRAVPTIEFDWEDCDYMPTPPGQSAIPSPWVGSGSIASEFGMEITNDRYRKDGWTLVYNTFEATAPGPLVNPYFILYNKYRGLLRIYLYLTTQFVTTSQSLQDGLSVVSPCQTSLLRFLEQPIVDVTQKGPSYYTEVHISTETGPSPAAANKWYMFQYELEYDPALSTLSNNQIQLSWFVNYMQVSELKLTGLIDGTIKGTVGGTIGDGGSDNIVDHFASTGKLAGTAALAGIGMNFLNKNKTNDRGGNKLGISESVFRSIEGGVSKALSNAFKDLPGAVMDLFSSIFGFGSGNQPMLVDLRFRAHLSMEGEITSKGSFPSMPVSFWVPGTNIATNSPGYIPMYNKSLGIVGFNSLGTLPTIKTHADIHQYIEKDPYDGSERPYNAIYLDFPAYDYSNYLIINPEVKNIADVAVSQQLFIDGRPLTKLNHYYLGEFGRPMFGSINYPDNPYPNLIVQFKIVVTPKNGDNPSIIIKSIKLKEDRDETWHDVVYIDEF